MGAADLGGSLPLTFSLNDIHRYAGAFLSFLQQQGLTSWTAISKFKKPRSQIGSGNHYIEFHPTRTYPSSLHYCIYHHERGQLVPITVGLDPAARSADFTVRAGELVPGYTLSILYSGRNTIGVKYCHAVKMKGVLEEFRRLQTVWLNPYN